MWFWMLLAICGGSEVSAKMELLDMTHEFRNGATWYWPNQQWLYEFSEVFKGNLPNGMWFEAHQFQAGEHGGTHIDAPCHFGKGKWTVEKIPLVNLVAPAVVVDIRQKAAMDPDSQLTKDDIEKWEQQHGQIPKRSVVFQCAGWDDRWSNKSAYFGNDRDDVPNFHFPAFHVEAVRFLVEERGIVGIGLDAPSLDYGAANGNYVVHELTSANNVYGLENVKGACQIPANGATVYVLPMKIAGGSGGPTRILAQWGDDVTGGTERHIAPLGRSLSIAIAVNIFYIWRVDLRT